MMNEEVIRKRVKESIKKWVGRNYGTQEVEDPSWNISALSRQIARDLVKAEPVLENASNYELTVLLPTEVNDGEAFKEIKEIVEGAGGSVVKYEYEGTKRLAYAINNHEKAQYTYYDLYLPENNNAVKISTTLNIKDSVLRYLMVRKDTRR